MVTVMVTAKVTYSVAWRTPAAPADAVTGTPVQAQAGFLATVAVVTVWAGLVAEEPRPARVACALALQGVTAANERWGNYSFWTRDGIFQSSPPVRLISYAPRGLRKGPLQQPLLP